MSIDCERWLNELTHKYLEYVQRCTLHRVKSSLRTRLEDLFDRLTEPTPVLLEHFSAMLSGANEYLDDYLHVVESEAKK